MSASILRCILLFESKIIKKISPRKIKSTVRTRPEKQDRTPRKITMKESTIKTKTASVYSGSKINIMIRIYDVNLFIRVHY